MIDLTSMTRNFRCAVWAGMFAAAAVISAAPAAAAPANPASEAAASNSRHDASMDPFLAGALGIVPFASGLYLSDRPARGVIFTAIDVLSGLGVYTSKYTVAGDPDNVRNYFLLMAANNVLDAWLSTRYALRAGHLQSFVLPMPGGGVAGTLAWRF